ncbi:MAG: type 1 glutamine amidotransferase [Phycisphaerales bacterium]
MAILILQHDTSYRSGRLGLTLRDLGFRLEVRRMDRDEPVPADLDDIEAVVSLGGPQQVIEGHAFVAREQAFLKSAFEGSVPVIGIGLGAQLLATALGGEVAPMEHPEAGFVSVGILPAGQTEPVLSGVPWNCRQFTRHASEITRLPDGAALLASSKRCKVQAFRVGMRSFGFQYHPECDRTMIEALIGDAKTMLHASGVTTDEFARDAEQEYERYRRVNDRLFLNLVNFAIPRVANESHA